MTLGGPATDLASYSRSNAFLRDRCGFSGAASGHAENCKEIRKTVHAATVCVEDLFRNPLQSVARLSTARWPPLSSSQPFLSSITIISLRLISCLSFSFCFCRVVSCNISARQTCRDMSRSTK